MLIPGHLGEMLRWWTDQRKVYKWLGGKNWWGKSIRLLQRKHQRMDGVLQWWWKDEDIFENWWVVQFVGRSLEIGEFGSKTPRKFQGKEPIGST